MTDPLEQSLIDLGMSIVGWSTRYDCVTLHRRYYINKSIEKYSMLGVKQGKIQLMYIN